MRISAFNSLSKLSNIHTTKTNNAKYTSNDIFVRRASFGKTNDEKTFSSFKKWSDETNFPNHASKITSNPANIIGDGFEGTVYSIPNNDDWVIKTFKRSNLVQYHVDKPEIIEIDDIAPGLNIGQKIASVRIPLNERLSEHFYILKKQTGKPLGVHHILMDNVSAGSTKMHLESLETIAKLPSSSYKKLVDDINYVVDCGYQFDGDTPQNYLLDKENKTINFVDINDLNTDGKSQHSEVLYAILGANFNEKFMNSHRPAEEKELADKLSTVICAKFITAMASTNSKFSNTQHFIQLIKSNAFTKILGTDDINEKLTILAENNLF